MRLAPGQECGSSRRQESGLRARRAIGSTSSSVRFSIRAPSAKPWEQSAPPGGRSGKGVSRSALRLSSTSCPRIRGGTSISWRAPRPSILHSIRQLPGSGSGAASVRFVVGTRAIRPDLTPDSRLRSSGCRRSKRWTDSWGRGERDKVTPSSGYDRTNPGPGEVSERRSPFWRVTFSLLARAPLRRACRRVRPGARS